MGLCITMMMWITVHIIMKTVQMTIDERLLNAVDAAARKQGASRSEFTRRALQEALEALRIKELERRHRDGYRRKPVRKGEFDVWEREQAWGEE